VPPLHAAAKKSDSPLQSRGRLWLRVLLAGPLAFLCAALVMTGSSLWLPKGAGQIDNLVLPVVIFPAIWAIIFFYTVLDRRLLRAFACVGALSLLHAALLAIHFLR
jgi:hypothetical protein